MFFVCIEVNFGKFFRIEIVPYVALIFFDLGVSLLKEGEHGRGGQIHEMVAAIITIRNVICHTARDP